MQDDEDTQGNGHPHLTMEDSIMIEE